MKLIIEDMPPRERAWYYIALPLIATAIGMMIFTALLFLWR